MEEVQQEQQIEQDVTDEAEAPVDPTRAKYQTEAWQDKWLAELEASRKERKAFVTRGNKTIERYADHRGSDATGSGRHNYNLFFANTEIKLSALYGQTPTPDIKRRFNEADDDVGRVAGMILWRNIAYELDEFGFDENFKLSLWDYKVPGLGVSWARMEQEGGDPIGEVDPETGEEGRTPIKYQCAAIDHVSWDDFYWAPCRTWALCPWVARRSGMTKSAIKARFGNTVDQETLDKLVFSKDDNESTRKENALKTKNCTEATVDVFEIWDKDNRLVWHIAEGCDVPLDVQSDTNEFDGFFPTPLPPLGRFTTSNTIPVSDFSLVQDLYNELDELNNRCALLAKCLQVRWAYNGAVPELKELYATTAEFEGIAVRDWATFNSEKGGLAGAIQFAPLSEIADAYQKCLLARNQVKEQINEVEGIADFMRGATAANETTLATAQKATFGTSRLSIDQQRVATYAQALLRLKAHLICKFYTPETIMARVGTLTPQDMELVPQAIALLKNKMMSDFVLKVSVDSIQLPNWNLDKAEKTEAFNAIMSSIGQVMPAIQQKPELTPFIFQLVKFVVSGYRGAQQVEGILDQAIEEFQRQGPQQPSEPSPEQIKAEAQRENNQTKMAIAQMQEETKRAKASLQAQIDAMQAQIDSRENEIQMIRAQTAQYTAIAKAHQGAK
jgi:hypothetical protein